MSRAFYTTTSLLILLTVVLIAGYFVHARYTELAEPCRTPLLYGVGDVDERFGLAKKDVLLAMLEAEKIWEEATGTDVFSYDGSAPLKVHFRYDERQAETVRARELETEIGAKNTQYEKMQAEIAELESAYDRAAATFRANVDIYEADLAKYNKKVKKINKEGGTDDEDEFDDLEDEKDDLDDRRKERESERLAVNGRVDVIQKKVNALNTFGRSLNTEVESFNGDFGAEKIFDQGEYFNGEIVIYQYETIDDLTLVIAHELGHARGVEHVADPLALMHEIFREQNAQTPQVTQADLVGLEQACNPEVEFRLF